MYIYIYMSDMSHIMYILHTYNYIDIQYQNLSTVTKYDSCAPWILNRLGQDLRVMVCKYLHELNAMHNVKIGSVMIRQV